jgi:serine/threonine protein kinase
MDVRGLYNEPFHPFYQRFSIDMKRRIYPKYLRSEIGVRYYYISFGDSKWFRDPNSPRKITADHARGKAPEQIPGKLYDPFLADIYQLGIVIQQDIIPVSVRLALQSTTMIQTIHTAHAKHPIPSVPDSTHGRRKSC